MSIATGRDPQANTLLLNTPESVQIAMPSVSYMEALSALEADLKYRRRFTNELNMRLSDAQRNLTSQYAQSLSFHLEQVRNQNNELIKEVEARLFEALNQLATKAEMIALSADMIQASLQLNRTEEPTDKLILNCILHHARLHPTEVKVFLSGNANDFGKPEVRETLRSVGINQYFASTQAFLDWWRSQSN
jgi:hypothetical protein